MAVSKRTIIASTLAVTILLIMLYSVSQILAPFAIGLLLAYFCSPIVSIMEKLKFTRSLSSALVLVGIIAIITLFSIAVIPLLYNQIATLAHAAITHKDDISQLFSSLTQNYEIPSSMTESLQSALNGVSSRILGFFGNFISQILQSGMTAVSILSMLFITPIVFYYFLLDWPKIVASIDSLIPRKMFKRYTEIKGDIDNVLSSFIRGQSLVCLIMGLYYALGLTAIGTESGIALGLISGLLSFIPYVGWLFSLSLSILIVAIQYISITKVLMTVALFTVGNFIENNFIVPKFIGTRIHLHPVWTIFGMFAGGTLLGFVGILIALPLTAVIAVLIRYLLKDYKNSSIYSS
jgi:predicted PurR-regulated permease PerM